LQTSVADDLQVMHSVSEACISLAYQFPYTSLWKLEFHKPRVYYPPLCGIVQLTNSDL